jgi:hypothetical protein
MRNKREVHGRINRERIIVSKVELYWLLGAGERDSGGCCSIWTIMPATI